LFNGAGCDLVIHAGDFVAPFTAEELRDLRAPVKAVFGNCDGEKAGLVRAFQGLGEIVDGPLRFSHAGLRFAVVHFDTSAATQAAAKHGISSPACPDRQRAASAIARAR
jgi:hypothetical protein